MTVPWLVGFLGALLTSLLLLFLSVVLAALIIWALTYAWAQRASPDAAQIYDGTPLLLHLSIAVQSLVGLVVLVPTTIATFITAIPNNIRNYGTLYIFLLAISFFAIFFNEHEDEVFTIIDRVYSCVFTPVKRNFIYPILNLLRIIYDVSIWVFNAIVRIVLFIRYGIAFIAVNCSIGSLANIAENTAVFIITTVEGLISWIANGIIATPWNMVPTLEALGRLVLSLYPTVSCTCGDLDPLWNVTLTPLSNVHFHLFVNSTVNGFISLLFRAPASAIFGFGGTHRPTFVPGWEALINGTVEAGMWVDFLITLISENFVQLIVPDDNVMFTIPQVACLPARTLSFVLSLVNVTSAAFVNGDVIFKGFFLYDATGDSGDVSQYLADQQRDIAMSFFQTNATFEQGKALVQCVEGIFDTLNGTFLEQAIPAIPSLLNATLDFFQAGIEFGVQLVFSITVLKNPLVAMRQVWYDPDDAAMRFFVQVERFGDSVNATLGDIWIKLQPLGCIVNASIRVLSALFQLTIDFLVNVDLVITEILFRNSGITYLTNPNSTYSGYIRLLSSRAMVLAQCTGDIVGQFGAGACMTKPVPVDIFCFFGALVTDLLDLIFQVVIDQVNAVVVGIAKFEPIIPNWFGLIRPLANATLGDAANVTATVIGLFIYLLPFNPVNCDRNTFIVRLGNWIYSVISVVLVPFDVLFTLLNTIRAAIVGGGGNGDSYLDFISVAVGGTARWLVAMIRTFGLALQCILRSVGDFFIQLANIIEGFVNLIAGTFIKVILAVAKVLSALFRGNFGDLGRAVIELAGALADFFIDLVGALAQTIFDGIFFLINRFLSIIFVPVCILCQAVDFFVSVNCNGICSTRNEPRNDLRNDHHFSILFDSNPVANTTALMASSGVWSGRTSCDYRVQAYAASQWVTIPLADRIAILECIESRAFIEYVNGALQRPGFLPPDLLYNSYRKWEMVGKATEALSIWIGEQGKAFLIRPPAPPTREIELPALDGRGRRLVGQERIAPWSAYDPAVRGYVDFINDSMTILHKDLPPLAIALKNVNFSKIFHDAIHGLLTQGPYHDQSAVSLILSAAKDIMGMLIDFSNAWVKHKMTDKLGAAISEIWSVFMGVHPTFFKAWAPDGSPGASHPFDVHLSDGTIHNPFKMPAGRSGRGSTTTNPWALPPLKIFKSVQIAQTGPAAANRARVSAALRQLSDTAARKRTFFRGNCTVLDAFVNTTLNQLDDIGIYFTQCFPSALAKFRAFAIDPNIRVPQTCNVPQRDPLQEVMIVQGIDRGDAQPVVLGPHGTLDFKQTKGDPNFNLNLGILDATETIIGSRAVTNAMDNILNFLGDTRGNGTGFWFGLEEFILCRDRRPLFCSHPNGKGFGLGFTITLVGLIVLSIVVAYIFPYATSAITILWILGFFVFLLIAYFESPTCFPRLPSCLLDDFLDWLANLLPDCINWDGLIRQNAPCTLLDCNSRTFVQCHEEEGFRWGMDNLIFLLQWKAPAVTNFLRTTRLRLIFNPVFTFLLDPALEQFNFVGQPTDAQIACFWATILNFAPLLILIILAGLVIALLVPLFWAIVALIAVLIFNFVAMLYTIANQVELGFVNNGSIANANADPAEFGYGGAGGATAAAAASSFTKVKVV